MYKCVALLMLVYLKNKHFWHFINCLIINNGINKKNKLKIIKR